jgi:D-inositol-3-phosphate glycosyltransferase
VRDGISGALVGGHEVGDWAQTLGAMLDRADDAMSRAAVAHAANFSWGRTVDALLAAYGRAIADYGAAHQRSPLVNLSSSRRNGRRWSMRRGIRA